MRRKTGCLTMIFIRPRLTTAKKRDIRNWERCQALKFDNLVDLFYFVYLVDLVGLVDFVYHYARKVRNCKRMGVKSLILTFGSDFPGEPFRFLKEKEIRQYGEFRTRRLVLWMWNKLCEDHELNST